MNKLVTLLALTVSLLCTECQAECKPELLEKITEAFGDLDKDGINEKVVVFNTNKKTELGYERELHVYKLNKGKWDLWYQTDKVIMTSEGGGMLGDPFVSLSISKGCIVIEHYGGSRLRWGYTHKYRYQNNHWELIGVTSECSEPTVYSESIDYNLSTNKMIYVYQSKDKDMKETFSHQMETLPTMDNILLGVNPIKIPNSDTVVYF